MLVPSLSLLRECRNIVTWDVISYNNELDEEEDLCEFTEYIKWDIVHYYPRNLSVDYVARYMTKIG